jgi:hypothetical protein
MDSVSPSRREHEIQIGRMRLQYLLETSERTDYSRLGAARVVEVRADKAIILGGAGTSPCGSRTERLNLRVETLSSIWFMTDAPSQSSATACSQLGSMISLPLRAARPRATFFSCLGARLRATAAGRRRSEAFTPPPRSPTPSPPAPSA